MTDRIEQRINSLNKRLNSEKRFRIYCIGAMSFALAWVLILFLNIFSAALNKPVVISIFNYNNCLINLLQIQLLILLL